MTPRPDPGTNWLVAGLPKIDRQRWLAHLEPVELLRGQVLFEAGQVPVHGYFPTTAVVSLVYMTEVGECEVAVVGREGVVGVSVFMGGRSTPGTAVVQRGGWAFRLRARMLKEEFEQVPAVMHVLLDYTLALSVQVAQTAVCNRHHMLDQRLCRRLLQGLDQQQDGELAISQGQLAGLLGVRRESITVEALKLRKAGVVRYSRGHIFVLDRAALERRACECYGVVKKEFDRAAPGATHLSLASAGGAVALGTTPSAASAGLATHFQRMREQERHDLARQLHDELGAILTGARLEVATLKARLDGASTDVQQRLKHLSETINRGIAFAERAVRGPDPSLLATPGLSASLGILAREFGTDCGISIAADLDEADVHVATQLTVYLVAQESLSNVRNYARANDTRIVLLDCGPEILMTVRDNGHGFDTAAVGRSSHGLAGMRHRVESCGGEFTVTSEAGRGTLIAVVLPKQPGAVGAAHEHWH